MVFNHRMYGCVCEVGALGGRSIHKEVIHSLEMSKCQVVSTYAYCMFVWVRHGELSESVLSSS